MNVKTKDLTQYFDFKILVKQIEGITDTGLEKKFATGLDWLFLANAIDWLQQIISPRPIANFKKDS